MPEISEDTESFRHFLLKQLKNALLDQLVRQQVFCNLNGIGGSAFS